MANDTTGSDDATIGIDRAFEDRRSHKRYDAPSYLRPVLAEDDRFIGEIVDISLGGLQLKLGWPLQRGGTYALRIERCEKGQDLEPILVIAHNVWMRTAQSEAATYAGFAFIALSSTAQAQINAVLAGLPS